MLLRTISIKNAEQEVLNGAVLCSFAIPMLSRNFLAYSLNEGAEVGESRVYLAMLNKAGQSYSLSSIEAEEDWRQVIQVFKEIVTHASLPEGRQQGAGGSTDIPYHLIDLKDCVIPTGKLSDHRSLTIKKNLVLKLISSEVSVACLPAIDSVELGVPMLDASISMSSQKFLPHRLLRSVLMRFLIRMGTVRQEPLRGLKAMHSMMFRPDSLRLEIQRNSLKNQEKLRLR